MSHGKITAQVGRELSDKLRDQGLDVLFDHGGKVDPVDYQVGKISAWFGDEYSANSHLAHLDIAVVERGSDRALALIEIEESSTTPKVIIGDIFATLLCDYVSFREERKLEVGAHTSLLVLIKGGKIRKDVRSKYIQNQAEKLIKFIQSGNASIGKIELLEFDSINDLSEVLIRQSGEWMKGV